MERVRVVQYGLGPIGCRLARLMASRSDLELVGFIDVDPTKVGKDAAEIVEAGECAGITISDDPGKIFAAAKPSIVVHATGSHLPQVKDQFLDILGAGLSVVSTCEELAYPKAQHPRIGDELDRAAKAGGATILGTGVNPGYVMDTLPIVMSAPCEEIRKVKVRRIQDAALRRLPFQLKIGAGLTIEEYQARVERGTVRHVGLKESMFMIADALGWELDDYTETLEPIVADRVLRSPFLEVEPGRVAGTRQEARGLINGEEVITHYMAMSIEGESAGDFVSIEGVPNVEMAIQGGTHGDIATAAIAVNSIPRVLAHAPGLVTMKDLPPVHWRKAR